MQTLKEEFIKSLTTTEWGGALYLTLPEHFGQVLALVFPLGSASESGGCETNFWSPPFPKMKQLQSVTRREQRGEGRWSFHE